MGREQELLSAVQEKDVGVVKRILLKSKASKSKLKSGKKLNINFQDADGMSCLHHAALQGQTDIMQLLIDHQAQPDLCDHNGNLAMHFAAWQGHDAAVTLLLRSGAGLNLQNSAGSSPLHLAALHAHVHVVSRLVEHGANPAQLDRDLHTALDKACLAGHHRVVEVLISTAAGRELLRTSTHDLLGDDRTTCLHLASRAGHCKIIRLLLAAGTDINRCTRTGTALHEAVMFGRLEVVRLLVEYGIDLQKRNASNRVALEVVDATSYGQRIARQMKLLLAEAAGYTLVRAIHPYTDPHSPDSLSFEQSDVILVLEQPEGGRWRGVSLEEDFIGDPGYFPASHVQILDANNSLEESSLSNSVNQLSLEPVCTDELPASLTSPPTLVRAQSQELSDSGVSLGASSGITSLRSPSSSLGTCDSQLINGSRSRNTSHNGSQASITSHKSAGSVSTPRASGLISPLTGSAPLVSSGLSVPNGHLSSGHVTDRRTISTSTTEGSRMSDTSLDRSLRAGDRRSVISGSSVGSLDPSRDVNGLDAGTRGLDPATRGLPLHDLIHAGLQDHDIQRRWLSDIGLEQYLNCFLQAGYDIYTISRMTPEDLTAIGITSPAHRKQLKAEITRLGIGDGIPEYKPASVGEWLRMLRLDCYAPVFLRQGLTDIDSLITLTWEDLEEVGVTKLGHQKKLMLGVDKLKRMRKQSNRSSMAGSDDSSGSARSWPLDLGAQPTFTTIPPSGSQELQRDWNEPASGRTSARSLGAVLGRLHARPVSGTGVSPRSPSNKASTGHSPAVSRPTGLQPLQEVTAQSPQLPAPPRQPPARQPTRQTNGHSSYTSQSFNSPYAPHAVNSNAQHSSNSPSSSISVCTTSAYAPKLRHSPRSNGIQLAASPQLTSSLVNQTPSQLVTHKHTPAQTQQPTNQLTNPATSQPTIPPSRLMTSSLIESQPVRSRHQRLTHAAESPEVTIAAVAAEAAAAAAHARSITSSLTDRKPSDSHPAASAAHARSITSSLTDRKTSDSQPSPPVKSAKITETKEIINNNPPKAVKPLMNSEHSSSNDSLSSVESCHSVIHVDSSTLPFANENVGTIKQKELDRVNRPAAVERRVVVELQQQPRSPGDSKPPIPPSLRTSNIIQAEGKGPLTDIDHMLQGLNEELSALDALLDVSS